MTGHPERGSTVSPTRVYGLGRTACHVMADDGRTLCGLTVEERPPAGTIVQLPMRWPAPRCKRCWREPKQ